MRWADFSDIPVELIVGWAVWYSDGKRYLSLDTAPANLPERDVQVMQVYYHHPEKYRHEDGTLKLYRYNFTGKDRYPIPNSDVVVCGDWTSLENHDRVTKEANAFRWPK